MSTALRSLRIAASFLTRLPIDPGPVSSSELARSVAYFPHVGLAIGLGLTVVATQLAAFTSPLGNAVVGVALLAGITGALHLDGVADLADAAGGGRGERTRMLEIMKDSRIGAHGAVALVLVLLAKVILLGDVLGTEGGWTALLLMPMVGRWACACLVATAPYARSGGTGSPFAEADAGQVVPVTTVITGLAAFALGGAGALLAMVVAGALAWALAQWMIRRLGGLTGDGYGASLELAELGFLLAI